MSPFTICDVQKLLSEKDRIIAINQERIIKLEARVEWLTRQVFGKRSEKIIVPDNAIDAFAGEATTQAAQAPTVNVPAHARKVNGHGRNELPKGFLSKSWL